MDKKELKLEAIWSDKKKEGLKDFISQHSKKQSQERLLTNKLLSIQYKIEDYLQNESEQREEMKVLDFVKMYLKVLNITKKNLAHYFDMEDSNLHKYLSGERKMNAELALKLSSFSHTKPEQWFGIQIKNELAKLQHEKKSLEGYRKYDYKNLIGV